MPKYKFNEIDKTISIIPSAENLVVYVPGKASTSVIAPKLFTTVAELSGATGYDTATLSYKLAIRLLKYGYHVLYEGVAETTGVPTITWAALKDKSKYNIHFLTTGGYSAFQSGMVECANARGDCVALLDHPADTIPSSVPFVENGVTTAVTAIRTYFGATNSTFASAFTPGFYTKDTELQTSSELTTQGQRIPASFGYLFALAKSSQNNPVWYSAAGSSRGVIDELSSVEYEFSNAEIEVLQARASTGEVELDASGDNKGVAYNPIAWIRPFGYILWGNRTLANNNGTTKATSFLNVRVMTCILKKALYEAARKYTFEQNSDILWVNFKSQITPLLDKLQTGNGIFGYRFTKEDTKAKARLKAKLVIVPIEAVEDFEFEIELNDSLEVVE